MSWRKWKRQKSPRERLEEDLQDALWNNYWNAHNYARRQLMDIAERVINGEAEITETQAGDDEIHPYEFTRDEWEYNDRA